MLDFSLFFFSEGSIPSLFSLGFCGEPEELVPFNFLFVLSADAVHRVFRNGRTFVKESF